MLETCAKGLLTSMLAHALHLVPHSTASSMHCGQTGPILSPRYQSPLNNMRTELLLQTMPSKKDLFDVTTELGSAIPIYRWCEKMLCICLVIHTAALVTCGIIHLFAVVCISKTKARLPVEDSLPCSCS